MTEKEAQWTELVRAWRASGTSARRFASENNLSESSLRWWARFAKGSGGLKRPVGRPPKSTTNLTIARVVRPGDVVPESDEVSEAIAIVVGRVRVAIRRGFDAELLRDVVRVLTEAR